MKFKFQGTGQMAILGAIILSSLAGRAYLLEGEELKSAEMAREMLETGNFIRPLFDFLPAWERLPLFSWIQALSMQVFGVGTFAARLPNAAGGILSILLLYRLGSLLYNPGFGLLWSSAFLSGLLPIFYFGTGIEAPWSSLLLFLGLMNLILFYWGTQQSRLPTSRPISRYLYYGGLFTGLASLMRGPEAMALLASVLGVYWLYKNLRFYISVQQFFLFFALAILAPLVWLSIDGVVNGPDAALAIPVHQWQSLSVAPEGEQKIWVFYVVLLLLGCFPASVFTLQALLNRTDHGGDVADENFEQNDFRRWMKMFLWTILVYYTLRSAKAPYYAFPAIFPVSYLAAWAVHRIQNGRLSLERWMYFALAGGGGVLTILAALQAFPSLQSGIPGFWVPDIPLAKDSENYAILSIVPAIVMGLGSFFAWRKLQEGAWSKGFKILFIASTLFSLSTMIFLLPPIAHKAYGPVVEFSRSRIGEDCYIYPFKFRNYSALFYAAKKANAHPRSGERDWLLFGETDKTVYFVARANDAKELAAYAHIEELYSKGGFVFFVRIR